MKAEFKKGQEVVVYVGDFHTCNVSTNRYLVRSCGLKQMHLIRIDDGSNAEFRMSVPFRGERRYHDVQCASVNVAEHTLKLRRQFAQWTREHYVDRTARAEQALRERGLGSEGYAKVIADGFNKFEAATADIA